ncbi:MAG TPA: ABC transporter permease subunit [Nevskiaceae bacterium]|nr:ABC transporter permease subunit [Nevskiaceae bacterium]
MDFSWLSNPTYIHYLWEGLINTVELTIISGFFGFLLAIAFAVAQAVGPKQIAVPIRAFSMLIRGTPLLLQLFFFYNGIGILLASFPAIHHTFMWPILRGSFIYAVLAFVVSVGAYVGEDLRGAMLSVPKGELEAADAYGMTSFRRLRRIWLPRTVQICMPTLSNEAILLLQSVPLVSTISVMDLLGAANIIRDNTLTVYPPLILIAAVYLVLAGIMMLFTRQLESHFRGRKVAAA